MDLSSLVSAVKQMAADLGRTPKRDEFTAVYCTRDYIEKVAGGWTRLLQLADLYVPPGFKKPVIDEMPSLVKPPRKLYIDIETAPISARVWGLYDQNIGLNQITEDWFILSFAASLDGEIHYLDQRHAKPINDDSMLLVAIHHLLCQADIVVTWNGDAFDIKKIYARFLKHGMSKPTSFRSVDGLKIARRNFKLTSNKLDYVAKYLGVTAKLEDRKFHGMDLWNACLAGSIDAWHEMEAYNKRDIVALEEVMNILESWDKKINYGIFEHGSKCSCGSKEFEQAGVIVTNTGKFERLLCKSCKKEFKSRQNLLHPETRKAMLT